MKKSSEVVLLYINYWIIVFSLVIFRLPILFGERYNLTFYPPFFIPFLVGIFLNLVYIIKVKPENLIRSGVKTLPLVLFWGIWLLALARTAFSDFSFDTFYIFGYVFTFLVFGTFTSLAFYISLASNSLLGRMQQATIYSFALFVALNLLLYFLDVVPDEKIYLTEYPAQMLSLVGVIENRVMFPMANGINSFGILAGATFVALFPLFLIGELIHRLKICALLLACIAVILLTDSRGALLFTIITVSVISLPRRWFNFARWLPFMVSIIPIVLTLTAPSIYFLDDLTWLNRPKAEWTNNDLPTEYDEILANANGSLSNRPVIWEVAVDELRQPKPIHFLGYGFRGHVVSKLSDKYAGLFQSYVRAKLASVHNIWLQSILSTGYLGLIVTLLFLIILIIYLDKFHYETGTQVYKSMLATIMYIVFVGALESSVSPDFFGLFNYLLIATIIVIVRSPTQIELTSEEPDESA